MDTPQIIVQRPALDWPRDASLIGYGFSGLLIAALNQGPLIAYLGWYVDSSTEGPVWHRWSNGEDAHLGVSLVVGIYALWIGGCLDVVLESQDGQATAFLVSSGKPGQDLAPLEQDILNLIHAHTRLHARALVECLPFPSKKRGIGAWFFSGAPSQKAKGESGWFKQTSTFYEDGPAWVQRALDLAKGLVALQAGSDLEDEIERDRRDEATFSIETGIFDAIQKLVSSDN
jgi:hypothetical protein